MYVCKEHLEIAMDDMLSDEVLPVITEITEEQKCEYCEAQAVFEVTAQAVRIEY